ncbi:dTDP-4-dehydrorhamnose reductase [Streptosporangium becharense]|uniref:dTDP-4-dehydrorhamnose reductase n=1 Tax=Streptosporangium becharense TaxID=1816182 RepID=A0A7W9IFU9_9ACTN|nr:dTDP-4-dehydrorhamnose reductase [Streptosporangium becharense]MBB2909093.1 dTDP-4-dehydrorhamnose reductase [Streptosporangium becharense]MBB5819888.1 dTDP-4-dehydrorhamnose reductase [Streptosporangium becharense]
MTVPIREVTTSRWLVTGAAGMLATELLSRLRAGGHPVVACGRDELDLRDVPAVHRLVSDCRPDVVVNCAGWTAVDDAETCEEEAMAVNGCGARALAEACGRLGARMIQPSTDYVFDGTALDPYPEDAWARPINAYGRTKLAGERAVLETLPRGGYVLRTAWLYAATGRNFVRTMVRLERENPVVHVVGDQIGQPTWAGDLAGRILALVGGGAPPGIYHATNSGQTSWYGLAVEIFKLVGADTGRVNEVRTKDFPRPARRPAYGVLGHGGWSRAGLPPMRHWREALRASGVLVPG